MCLCIDAYTYIIQCCTHSARQLFLDKWIYVCITAHNVLRIQIRPFRIYVV